MRNSSIKAMMENELRLSSRDMKLTCDVEFISSFAGIEEYKVKTSNGTVYTIKVEFGGV